MDEKHILTDEEAKFCLLFVNGDTSLAGNATECYLALHPELDRMEATTMAKSILKKPVVKDRLKELNEVNLHDAEFLRPQITETLLSIMRECAVDSYRNENGDYVSPAPLRAVAVHAAKELNSMYGIKEAIAHKVSVDAGGSEGVTFNIIMPNANNNNEMEE